LAGLLAADGAGLAALGSLDTLLLGGEALPSALVDRLRPVLRGRLFNMYGPTETTVWSTFAEVGRDGGDITIGRPIANTRVYVVDRHLELAPVGVPGELVIGGAGVTAGYLDRPELTAERFVSLSRDEGVAYRTGDLVRWRRDGTLEFLGRLDQQVKIRGFRIELGEVESTLTRHPEVQDAVVVARTDGGTDARLVAYVIGKEAGEAAPDPQGGTRGGLSTRLRAYLRDRLPEYMIPGAFVALESFPQTPNGKVDRKALPALDRTAMTTSTGYAAPTSDVEKIIAAIWQEMLSMDRVGVDHNFFELGANSLLMVKANVRLRAKLETEVPLVDMFRFPTVRTLAAHVVGGGLGTAELLRETQKRVQARRDALSTRRTARRGSRAEDE
jgi:acyl carrier protein